MTCTGPFAHSTVRVTCSYLTTLQTILLEGEKLSTWSQARGKGSEENGKGIKKLGKKPSRKHTAALDFCAHLQVSSTHSRPQRQMTLAGKRRGGTERSQLLCESP